MTEKKPKKDVKPKEIDKMLSDQFDTQIAAALNYYLADFVDLSDEEQDVEVDSGLKDGDNSMYEELFKSAQGGKFLRGKMLIDVAMSDIRNKNLSEDLQLEYYEAVFQAAVALELFQTSMLVHDDIIDEDPQRRGRPSSFLSLGPKRALLLGDLLLCAADNTLDDAIMQLQEVEDYGFVNLGVCNEIRSAWSIMKRNVLIGQALDFKLGKTKLDELSDEELEDLSMLAFNVMRLKTASYTTIAPYIIGKLISTNAYVESDDSQLIEAEVMGTLFQIGNDIEGLEKDLESGNISCALAVAYAESGVDDRERINECMTAGSKISAPDLEWLKSCIARKFGEQESINNS
ncbi:hypothetical protein FACS1894125_0570 [Actinomycetota bacterium]|nr:hypothetical protein FACS1894125_0570 [Actinomycetota bacterium]